MYVLVNIGLDYSNFDTCFKTLCIFHSPRVKKSVATRNFTHAHVLARVQEVEHRMTHGARI